MHLAKDGVPVVIHDATLRRTGLRAGEVSRMTAKELGAVDVGSWFNRAYPALAHSDYEQQRVPTLAEVFQFLRNRPATIYVELKSNGGKAATDLVHAVAGLMRQFGMHERVVVISFDHAAVAQIKLLDPSIRTGSLFEPRRRPALTWGTQSMLKAAAACGANELLPHRLLARPKLIEQANNQGLRVVVWTVDEPAWVLRAGKLGIDALITNDPESLLAIRPPALGR